MSLALSLFMQQNMVEFDWSSGVHIYGPEIPFLFLTFSSDWWQVLASALKTKSALLQNVQDIFQQDFCIVQSPSTALPSWVPDDSINQTQHGVTSSPMSSALRSTSYSPEDAKRFFVLFSAVVRMLSNISLICHWHLSISSYS